MQPRLLVSCVLAALALAACGKDDRPKTEPAAPATGGSTAAPAAPRANTPSTPANIGQPTTMEEKREGANPVQGQVDPKRREQHKDFQQRGDQAGPTSAETKPAN